MIEITFLGSGSSVPTVKRNHPAIFLKYGKENILFDCGEGTQRQFRKAKINPCKLDRIFISHWHADHVLGIPGLLHTLALNDYNKTLNIYGPKGTKKFINQIMEIFNQSGKIDFKVNEISKNKVLDEDNFVIYAEKMEHGIPTLSFRFAEKDKIRLYKKKIKNIPSGPLLGKLKKGKDIIFNGKKVKAKSVSYIEKGKIVSIIFDTRLNTNIKKIALNSDLMICESTYLDEKELAYEHKHLTLENACNIAKESKAKKLVIFHISQRHEKNEKEMLSIGKKIFKNLELAKDFDKFEI